MKQPTTRRGLAAFTAALLTTAGVAIAAPATADVPDGQQSIALHNDTAENFAVGSEACSFDGADPTKSYWHFVLAPNNGTWRFETIHLATTADPGGAPYPYLPNGTQYDNVFVEVPVGETVGDLITTGSYALISPGEPTPEGFNLSHTCSGTLEEPELLVTKTVDTTWDRRHRWDIDKVLVDGPTAVWNGDVVIGADYTYRIDRTELAAADSYSVEGTITVENLNDTPALITGIIDELAGFTCVVDPLPTDPVVVDGTDVTVGYRCGPIASLPTGDLTNTATVTYTFDDGAETGTAVNTPEPVEFSAVPDVEHDTDPILLDDKYTGAQPGVEYTIRIPASTATCVDGFTNTASLYGDDETLLDTDDVTVSFCVSIGGRTIGFWSNRNGLTALGTGNPTLWSQVRASWPSITDPLTDPLTDATRLQAFLTERTTNCTGDCDTMLRAQFIATALNTLYIEGYAQQYVTTPVQFDTIDQDPDGCATVEDLLASVYSQYLTLSMDGAAKTTAKTVLDVINQNRPLEPFQCQP